MRLSAVARSLLVLGAIVGGMAGLALALGLRLDDLPPWMITVGMYKLAFIAAAGLFVAGAVLGRAARGTSSAEERVRETADGGGSTLGPGAWHADEPPARKREPIDRDRRHD